MAQLDSTEFKAQTASLYADNTSGDISAADLRAQMDNIADSASFKTTNQVDAPTATDDDANTGGRGSFTAGDIWIDVTNDIGYVCLDATVAAAQWLRISAFSGAEIKALYEAEDDTNAFTDIEKSKLTLIPESPIAYPNRLSLLTDIAAGATWPEGTIIYDGISSYISRAGSNIIAGASDIAPFPLNMPTPYQFGAIGDGVTDDTASFTAWWNYLETLTSAQGVQHPNTEQISGYIPSGHFLSVTGLILSTQGVGVTVYGDGPTSQLENIDFRLDGTRRCSITRLRLRGETAVGIELDGSANGTTLSELTIRDKDSGIRLTQSTQTMGTNINLFKNTINLDVPNPSGDAFTNITSTSAKDYCYRLNGAAGEFKLTNSRGTGAGLDNVSGKWANMLIFGDDGAIGTSVECYFTQVTLTTALEGSSDRTYTITDISDNGSGNIRVTTLTPHQTFIGHNEVDITGTVNYDGINYDVIDVISPTVMDLNVSFVANESSGTVLFDGWDLVIETQDQIQTVNDMFFIGGNINNLYMDGGFNVNFTGTRIKQQAYIGDTFGVSRLFFVRNGRGRADPTNADLPISGPGSDRGWGEVSFNDDTPSWTADGGSRISLRTPHTATGVGLNNLPVNVNEINITPTSSNLVVGGEVLSWDLSGPGDTGLLTLPATARLSFNGAEMFYEEGNDNGTLIKIADAVIGGNEAITTQTNARWTRIGNRVFLDLRILNIDTTGLAGGNDLFITGLPYTCAGVPAAGSITYSSLTLSPGFTQVTPVIENANDYLRLIQSGNDLADTALPVSSINAPTDDLVAISISFRI